MLKRILQNITNPVQLFKKIIKLRRISLRFRSSDKAYWDSLKDIHKGQRGFIIGNGPSLQMSDLDLLVGDVSIASNKI